MEEDIFKKMRGVKPFKKDAPTIKVKTNNKKNIKSDIKSKTKITTEQKISEQKVSSSQFKLSFGDVNKELKREK